MFKTRTISAIVLVIIFVAVFTLGAPVTGVVFGCISLKGVQELLRVYHLERSGFAWLAYGMTVCYYAFLLLGLKAYVLPLIILYLLMVLSVYVFRFPKYKDADMMAAFLSFLYVSVMLSYVYQIRAISPSGEVLVYLIFVSSWINDVCAYLAGITLGRHQMTPKLSPKKSIEGGIGGIIGAGLVGMVFGAVYVRLVHPIDYGVLIFGLIGAVGAVPAVIGDLTASAIKRNHDVKDYGRLIPGHGGVMDRFDSVIFTAPIVYYMLTIIGPFQ